MALAAAGPASLPAYYFRLLLADSTTLRTWFGAANQAEALARIYRGGYAGANYPYATVGVASLVGEQKAHTIAYSGSVEVTFADETPEAYQASLADAETWFTNQVGQVWADVMALCGTGGYGKIDRFEANDPPGRAEPGQDSGDWWEWSFMARWSDPRLD